ncbi:hypothetical protein [Peribacillus faecalis]|uniref:hypothetical protein n=1 Tax=Peribacillus faecalis TaxID=2772559 RepID=UPI001F389614|nr:hypothetical protein [Peribacillus faecalis]
MLVLDEPTNHLDIESREVMEETLEKVDGMIIAISYDRYFLQKLFAKTVWIKDGQVYVHNGPYEWAREKQNCFDLVIEQFREEDVNGRPLFILLRIYR